MSTTTVPRIIAIAFAIAVGASSCASPSTTTSTAEPEAAIEANVETPAPAEEVGEPDTSERPTAVTPPPLDHEHYDYDYGEYETDEYAYDDEFYLYDEYVPVWDVGPDYLDPHEGLAEPAAFADPWLAFAHSGPWGDHSLGRCLDSPRVNGATYIDTQIRGMFNEYGPYEAYVAQSAIFPDEATAKEAFDNVDRCYIGAAVAQFVESVGWYGYDAAFASNEWLENFEGEQALFTEFDHWDLPIVLVAIQRGQSVSVAISYDGWVEGTYLAADALIA